MGSGEHVADLIASAYAAVGDASRWPTVLGGLSDLAGGVGGVLLSIDTKRRRSRMVASINMDPDTLDAYAAHYHTVDPWIGPVLSQPVGALVPTERHLPHENLTRTEFYNDWLRPQGIERSLGCVMLREDGTLIVLGLPRGPKQGRYKRSDIERLRAFTPHFQRALQLDRHLGRSNGQRRVALEALDRMAAGVFLVDRARRVRPVNAAAEEIARADDGFTWHRSMLRVQHAADQRTLDRLIGEAVGATEGGPADNGTSCASGMMTLSRPSGRLPYSLLVSPLAENAGGLLGNGARATVVITDPERGNGVSRDGLTALYGLTPSEARLVERLMAGDRLYAAADALHMARETARSHLKHIFLKTDTHSQADLIRLLLSSAPAPTDPPNPGA